ncbi:MAG: hypothetical protein ACYDC3_14030 [Candidatus Binataceae bacterium]
MDIYARLTEKIINLLEHKCDEMTLLVIQLITWDPWRWADAPFVSTETLAAFDSRSPRAHGLQESIIVRFRSDPDSIQTHSASGKPAQVAHHDSMFEQMFSEGAGDSFTLDFHHHEVGDAGENVDTGQL